MRIADHVLVRASLVVSLLGVAGLFVLFATQEPSLCSIQEAKLLPDDEQTGVQGTVKAIKHASSLTILQIEGSCTITATTGQEVPDGWLGQHVVATGTMTTYKGERELQLSELRISDNY